MEKQNVTLSLPKDLLRKAKVLAIERNTSLSSLLAQLLIDLVEKDEQYDVAMRRHLAWLEQSPDLGSAGQIVWRRDELYER